MGSLSSSPKAPPQPQIVSVPTQTTPVATTQSPTEEDIANQASQTRQDSLLRRARGRLGTITTGFQGFLSDGNTQNNRKTLLGE